MFEQLKQIENKITGLVEEERRKIYEASFLFLAAAPLRFQELMEIILKIPERDAVKIHLSAESEDVFVFDRNSQKAEYERFIQELMEDEMILARLEIKKSIQDRHFSVYRFGKFAEDMVRLPIEEAMKSFSALLNEADGYIIFDLFDSSNIFYTKTMFFRAPENGSEISVEFERIKRLQDCREMSYFYNQESYELLPDDFKIVVGYKDNPLAELFRKMETILSLCMVASNASIHQDKVKLQIMGQRSVEYTYRLSEIEGNPVLYRIYDWIYLGGSSLDKAVIARNIICLHCKYEQLQQMDSRVLAAIQSNYNLYLKENVTQYLELKNKVAEFISGIVSKTGEYATELLDKFKTNLIAIFGFLFTVIIANIVSDQPLDNIFTRDITVILELVLAGSLVYLFISYKQSKYQMKKVYDSYDELKKSYRQILTEDDIRECFQDDQILSNMKETINRSQRIYLIIWIGFLVALFICIECLSDEPMLRPFFEAVVRVVK